MGIFKRHASCPKCGSKDNLAIYEDGKYCFGCHYTEKNGEATSTRTHKVMYRLPELIDVDLTGRKIGISPLHLYGVGQDYEDEWVYFPYYKDGRCVGAKKRRQENWEEKDYRWEGDGSVGLWGMQTCKDYHKSIIITEGEFDALAAYMMYGLKHSVVSIAHGAAAAAKDIQQHMEFLNRFESIYLCFDMDEPGRKAVDDVIPLFAPGRAKVVILPNGFKDANDMLKAGSDTEFRRAVDSAQGVIPPEFVFGDRALEMLRESIRQSHPQNRRPTGFPKLDAVIGGFNKGELITVTADTGIGKTTFALQLALNAMEQGLKVFLLTLETAPGDIYKQLVEMKTKYRLHSDPNPDLIPEEFYIKEAKWIVENCTVYNRLGSMSLLDLENALNNIVRMGKADVVVLDHITAATQSMEGKQVQVIDTTMAMLVRVTTHLGLWTLVISHVNRDKDDRNREKLSLNSIRNSEGIAQYSHAVLGLVRSRDDDVTKVVILKAHRRYGILKDFYIRWDKDDRCFYEQDDVKNDESQTANDTKTSKGEEEKRQVPTPSASEAAKFQEEEQIQCQEVCVEGREDIIQEQVRESSVRNESEFDVRDYETLIHSDVRTRLHDFYKKRFDYLRRDEGSPETGGQVEVDCGEEDESNSVLEALIRECNPANRKVMWHGFHYKNPHQLW